MGIIKPEELEKLTAEEEEEYKRLEEYIMVRLKEVSPYPCGDSSFFCYNVDLEKIPARRVLEKIGEEALNAGWSGMTFEHSREGIYLRFWKRK